MGNHTIRVSWTEKKLFAFLFSFFSSKHTHTHIHTRRQVYLFSPFLFFWTCVTIKFMTIVEYKRQGDVMRVKWWKWKFRMGTVVVVANIHGKLCWWWLSLLFIWKLEEKFSKNFVMKKGTWYSYSFWEDVV